ncbi:hypothetical protein THTE_1129 [Thermogutta terrifontis]|uniref:Uncharacterized protein n=1 Tax=Thermogutta terrifontis TaxID=1331910 RepID=A0A286RCP2_9BACT|nr:hypothetical protein THTE_1129 [Thermogutta terrifontis]
MLALRFLGGTRFSGPLRKLTEVNQCTEGPSRAGDMLVADKPFQWRV